MTDLAPVKDPIRWERTILGSPQWVTEITWSNDGGQSWDEATYISGSVTVDATNQIRWTTEGMQLLAPYGWEGFSPFRTRMKIRHGLQYGPNDRDLIGMGVYRITSASRQRSNPELITVSGASFEHYLIAPWGASGKARQFASQSAQGLVENLIREVLPDATIAWRGVDISTMVPALSTDGDRWQLIDGQTGSQSIARALGARVFCDGDGNWIISPRGAIEDPAVWSSKVGESEIDATETVSLNGLYNIVAVYGTDPILGTAIGPYQMADTDPFSKTNVNLPINKGGIGKSTLQYTSDIVTNPAQAMNTGSSILKDSRGLQQTISFSRLYDPRLRPDCAGTVDTGSGEQKSIFDSLTFDLTGQPIEDAVVRTTSTQFTGQLTEFVDPSLSGGE